MQAVRAVQHDGPMMAERACGVPAIGWWAGFGVPCRASPVCASSVMMAERSCGVPAIGWWAGFGVPCRPVQAPPAPRASRVRLRAQRRNSKRYAQSGLKERSRRWHAWPLACIGGGRSSDGFIHDTIWGIREKQIPPNSGFSFSGFCMSTRHKREGRQVARSHSLG